MTWLLGFGLVLNAECISRIRTVLRSALFVIRYTPLLVYEHRQVPLSPPASASSG